MTWPRLSDFFVFKKFSWLKSTVWFVGSNSHWVRPSQYHGTWSIIFFGWRSGLSLSFAFFLKASRFDLWFMLFFCHFLLPAIVLRKDRLLRPHKAQHQVRCSDTTLIHSPLFYTKSSWTVSWLEFKIFTKYIVISCQKCTAFHLNINYSEWNCTHNTIPLQYVNRRGEVPWKDVSSKGKWKREAFEKTAGTYTFNLIDIIYITYKYIENKKLQNRRNTVP